MSLLRRREWLAQYLVPWVLVVVLLPQSMSMTKIRRLTRLPQLQLELTRTAHPRSLVHPLHIIARSPFQRLRTPLATLSLSDLALDPLVRLPLLTAILVETLPLAQGVLVPLD